MKEWGGSSQALVALWSTLQAPLANPKELSCHMTTMCGQPKECWRETFTLARKWAEWYHICHFHMLLLK